MSEKLRLALSSKKSDQLNADDLIATDMIIKITSVDIQPNKEQTITIHYENEGKKPYRPCLTMARLITKILGSEEYWAGNYLKLYRDPTIKWAGEEVGGIRIKAMTGCNSKQTFTVKQGRGFTKVTVEPLPIEQLNIPQPKQEIPIEERVKKAINVLHSDNVNDKIINAASALLDKLDTSSDLHYDLTQALTLHTQLAETMPELAEAYSQESIMTTQTGHSSNSEQPAFIVDDNPFDKGE